jgi:cytidine deaminase
MKHKTIEIGYTEFESIDELTQMDAELLEKARETAKCAWAPYSGFHVGASVLLDSGQMITGNNQENAAYPSGICAERVALYAANANYSRSRVVAIAISAFNKKGRVLQPISPCGSCLQAIRETEERFGIPIRLILDGAKKIIEVEGIKNLMPLSFNSNSM